VKSRRGRRNGGRRATFISWIDEVRDVWRAFYRHHLKRPWQRIVEDIPMAPLWAQTAALASFRPASLSLPGAEMAGKRRLRTPRPPLGPKNPTWRR
jgi:hypothetical protein